MRDVLSDIDQHRCIMRKCRAFDASALSQYARVTQSIAESALAYDPADLADDELLESFLDGQTSQFLLELCERIAVRLSAADRLALLQMLSPKQ